MRFYLRFDRNDGNVKEKGCLNRGAVIEVEEPRSRNSAIMAQRDICERGSRRVFNRVMIGFH